MLPVSKHLRLEMALLARANAVLCEEIKCEIARAQSNRRAGGAAPAGLGEGEWNALQRQRLAESCARLTSMCRRVATLSAQSARLGAELKRVCERNLKPARPAARPAPRRTAPRQRGRLAAPK